MKKLPAVKNKVALQQDKEKCVEDLMIARKELRLQKEEKEKRAAELKITKTKLADQNIEKETRAKEAILSKVAASAERTKDKEYIMRLASIVEFSDDAIISKSLDGVINSWNKGAERMFEYTAVQAIGAHISLLIPKEYISEEKMILQKVHNNEIVHHYETVRQKKSGELFHVSITVSPLKDEAENIVGVSKIVRDITSRKKSEAKLIRANTKLGFENEEKEKRAAELIIANKELAFQNREKEERSKELVIANNELAFQNLEKEKRAAELFVANSELKKAEEDQKEYIQSLETMMFMTSHKLRSPIAQILGILHHLDSLILSAGEVEEMKGFLKLSAQSLDNLTRELTTMIYTQEMKLKLKHKNKV